MRKPLVIYYRDDMVPADVPGNYSKSPTKPRRFLEFLRSSPLWPHIEVRDGFEPLRREQVLLAHKPTYVDAFLAGSPRHMAESNGLVWSAEFRDSVLLTNGCLLAALTAAVETPQHVMMAPVSGFHHARPDGGSGFCTFSGQAIAALELFQRRGLRGAWIDLDGHYGNSIEDTRDFAEDLDSAIPPGLNLNPMGAHGDYLRNLEQLLRHLEASADLGKLDYVAVAHGADSHEWDQLGYQCSTAEWLQAADMVYSCLARIRIKNQRIAVALGLFGGYRDDHPESVLGLHAMDAARALVHLAGISQLAGYVADVRPRVR